MRLRAGERFGRYELGELLGKGGMGEVYSAHDPVLQRRVALKALVPSGGLGDAAVSPEGAARILREARAAARISHPNAVAIFDVGEVEGIPFIAMEYVPGATLRAHIGDATIPLATRLRWLIDIARGLGAAHKLSVVHRDVKPDNVIVGPAGSGVVKVLDFGIARRTVTRGRSRLDAGEPLSVEEAAAALGTLTAEGVVVGTPAYMSPEQMRGDVLDGRADQFSWGVVAFELLTGKPPWQGVGVALVAQILSREITSLQESVPGLSARADAVIRIALSKSREGRFATMEELADELEPYAAAGDVPESSAATRSSNPATEMELALTEQMAREASKGETTARAGTTPRTRRGSGAAVGVVATVLALVAGGIGIARIRASRAALIEARRAAAVAEMPSQMSANPEATAAYLAGTKSLHDAAVGASLRQLDRAIELDPLFAAARLRRALVDVLVDLGQTSGFREDLQAARNSRASLGEHDRLLLDAFEPWAAIPPDLAESERRLAVAETSHPADAEFPFERGLVLDAEERFEEALAALRLAADRDPKLALAWRAIGPERLALDDVPGAMEAYRRCVEISPGGTSCLGDLSILQANEGKCEELVETSRRLIALEPTSPAPYLVLADGLVGSGHAPEAIQSALRDLWDRERPEERRETQLENGASLAVLRGDFTGAEAMYAEIDNSLSAASDDESHFESFYERIVLDFETGRSSLAVALAERYLRERPAWSAGPNDEAILAYVAELTGGAIGRQEFDALRNEWLRRNPGSPGERWIAGYAFAVRSREEAAAALHARPKAQLLVSDLSSRPGLMEPVGRTYLLAGRFDEAVRYLSRASSWCPSLNQSPEIVHATRATLELGDALEARGDRGGACAAYDRVLQRWGAATPPSVTASKARDRKRSLECAAR